MSAKSIIVILLIGLIAFSGCIQKEPSFEVYRWYESTTGIGFCGPVHLGDEKWKWIVLDVYATMPTPAIDGVRGWHYKLVGSDGKNYTWFFTDTGCIKNFYSEPTGISPTKLSTRGNLVFVLPENVDPVTLVLEIDNITYTRWTFDQNLFTMPDGK